MKFHIATIPQEIMVKYNLLNIVYNQGFVYVKIVKGMYGLKQAGIIAHRAQCWGNTNMDLGLNPSGKRVGNVILPSTRL